MGNDLRLSTKALEYEGGVGGLLPIEEKEVGLKYFNFFKPKGIFYSERKRSNCVASGKRGEALQKRQTLVPPSKEGDISCEEKKAADS